LIIDRFEDSMAVCETFDRRIVNIPRQRLPAEAKEGDIINIEGKTILIDHKSTTNRKKAIQKSLDELIEKNAKKSNIGLD
jgi:hypothetical protein